MKISIVALTYAVSANAFTPIVVGKHAVHRLAMMDDEIDFDGENMTCLTVHVST